MTNSSTEKTELLRAVKAVSLEYILTAFVIMVSVNLSTLCEKSCVGRALRTQLCKATSCWQGTVIFS
jgi:hypothetical protein